MWLLGCNSIIYDRIFWSFYESSNSMLCSRVSFVRFINLYTVCYLMFVNIILLSIYKLTFSVTPCNWLNNFEILHPWEQNEVEHWISALNSLMLNQPPYFPFFILIHFFSIFLNQSYWLFFIKLNILRISIILLQWMLRLLEINTQNMYLLIEFLGTLSNFFEITTWDKRLVHR